MGGNVYYFLHGDASSTLSLNDSLVEVVGVTAQGLDAGTFITL